MNRAIKEKSETESPGKKAMSLETAVMLHAIRDAAFKAELLKAPKEAILGYVKEKLGEDAEQKVRNQWKDIQLKVMEDTEKVVHWQLPFVSELEGKKADDMSDAELLAVAGGGNFGWDPNFPREPIWELTSPFTTPICVTPDVTQKKE